jgi:hypothetical protein
MRIAGTHQESKQTSVGYQAVLFRAGNLEGGYQHDEHEHVVDRERTLDQEHRGVAGGFAGIAEHTEERRRQQAYEEPYCAPCSRRA